MIVSVPGSLRRLSVPAGCFASQMQLTQQNLAVSELNGLLGWMVVVVCVWMVVHVWTLVVRTWFPNNS